MYLKRLDIQGFKSFASKVALEFPDAKKDDKGITAIVGPNGSGKSNSSDAIRWVLGEQSMKTLRGKKAEDLIFSGSKKRSRLGFAEVSLYLDNSDHIAPIDYEEIVVTRRLYRSGDSEYLLNKKPVRLADILMLLAKAKFAQKTYSVIGQGMIDSILIAPPSERKDFFDEAAGVKEFQIKRNTALNKLKNTQTNLQQIDIMLQEIEPRLRSLTRQVSRLERREKVEQELQENQIQYYSSLLSEIETKLGEVNKQEKEVSPQIKMLEKEMADTQEKLNQAAKEATRSESFIILQQELSSLVGKKNSLLREQAILKGKLDVEYAKSGQINLVWLEKRKDEVKNRIVELSVQIKQKQSDIEEENELTRKKDKLQEIEMEINLLKGKVQELSSTERQMDDEEIKDVLREIFEDQKNFIDKFKKIETLEQLAEIKNEATQIFKKISTFRETFVLANDTENIASQLEQNQNYLNLLQEEKRDLLTEINEISVELKINQEKNILLEQELNREESELSKIENEVNQAVNQQQTKKDESQIKVEVAAENAELEKQIKELDDQMIRVQEKIDGFNAEEEKKKAVLIQLQRDYSDKQTKLYSLNNRLNEINISLTRLNTKKEGLIQEINTELKDEKLLIKDFKESVNRDILYNKIQNLKHQLELIGGIDEEVIKEYEQIKERYEFLHTQSTDLKKAIDSLEHIIIELDQTIRKEFNASFDKINKEFDKFFKILFNGGKAKLVKTTEEQKDETKTEKELALEEIQKENQEEDKDTIEVKIENDLHKKFKKINIYSGIEIQAMPPDKKISNINALSGGERALTAIALVCAIISCNPSPFVVLDEVDAALDEANSDRFAAILVELSHKTQFIAITHNRATMHKAKILYGVTMGEDGVSKLLSVKLEDAERLKDEGKVKLMGD